METRQSGGVSKVAKIVEEYFTKTIGKEGKTLSVERTEKGWKVEFEAIDYPGAGFDPTLGLYEVSLNQNLDITGYKRIHLRKQTQMSWSAPQQQ